MRKLFQLVGEITLEGMAVANKRLNAFDADARKAFKTIDKFGKTVSKVGMDLTRNLTAPIAAFGVVAYKGVQAASDLAETVSKVQQIFGASSSEIESWAGNAATSLGQSKQQALDAAATFATFGRSAGMSGENLVAFSTKFTGLATDLASFNNTSPEEAITAIGAAMRGEMEPMRRYGVLLDDASMRQKALELGIVSSIKTALTPQQKVLAASALIMAQTTKAQGDFERTSGGLANQQRILTAQVKDLTAEFGKAFLPVALQVAAFVRDDLLPPIKALVDWFNNLPKSVRETVIILVALAAAIGPAVLLIGKLVPLLKFLPALFALCTGGMAGLNVAMRANPIGFVIGLIALLVTAGIILYKNWDLIKEKLIDAWDAVAYGTQQAIGYIKRLFLSYIKLYVDGINTIGQYIPGLNKALAFAQDGLQGMIDATKADMEYRKAARQIAKLDVEDKEKLVEVVKKAEEATVELTEAEVNHVAVQKTAVKATKEQVEAAEDLTDKRAEFEKDWSNTYMRESMTRLEYLEIEKQQALASADELCASREDIEAVYAMRRAKLQQEELASTAKTEKTKRELFDEYTSAASDAANGLENVLSGLNENELIRIDQRLEKQKAAIMKSQMSDEEKAKAIEAIEIEADKRKTAIAKKQAAIDKAAALFSIGINTAVAVVKALPNLILAGIIGALGIAQAVVVASKPLPLAEGAVVKKRPGGILAQIGEGNDDEIVMPVQSGIQGIVDGIMSGLQGLVFPSPAMAFAGGGGGTVENHWHIGTLVADDRGIKELERRQSKFRVAESQRRGNE
jgi:hypothetical protein